MVMCCCKAMLMDKSIKAVGYVRRYAQGVKGAR